jgi:two-component system nitrogen regulation response regulator NtrX
LEERLEEELFGSKVFPKSVLERCDGGTLYLGHVHKITPKMQKRLLGFLLRSGFYHNVTGQFIETDVRLIVSMGREAAYKISSMGFDEHLYYRLSATPLFLPSVSERKADIPLLMRLFLKLHHSANIDLTDSFMKAITAYDWPGNIREMANTAQFIANAQIKDRPIDVIDLPTTIRWQATKGVVADSIFESKSDIPKSDAEVALRHFDGNISRAADFFGVSRTTFYRLLGKEKD